MMRHEQLVSSVVDFVTRPQQVYGAALLFGEWGAGKSTFFRTTVKPALEIKGRKVAYFSVAGLASTKELDQALLMAVYPILNTTLGEVVGLAARVVGRYLKVEAKDIDLKADLSKSTVVVIDDLERYGGATQSLFGFIQQIVEANRTPCILIADEGKLKGQDERRNDAAHPYAEIREKVVACAFEFVPDVSQTLDGIVRSYADQRERENLAHVQNQILSAFSSGKTTNIRTMVFAIDVCRQVLAAATEAQLDGDLKQMLAGLVVATIIEIRRDHDSQKELIRFHRDHLHAVATMMRLNDDVDREDTITEAFIKRYTPLTPMQWPALPRLADLLESGIFDAAALIEEFVELKARAGRDEMAKLTGDVRFLSNEEFKEVVGWYKTKLRDARTLALEFVLMGCYAFLAHAERGLIDETIQDVSELHREVLDRLSATRSLTIDQWDDASTTFRLDELTRYGRPGLEIKASILAALAMAKMALEDKRRQDLLLLLTTDYSAFHESVFKVENGWRFVPLFVNVDAPNVAASLIALSTQELARVHDFLRWRQTDHNRGEFAREVPVLEELIRHLSNSKAAHPLSIHAFNLKLVVKFFEDLIRKYATRDGM